MYDGSTGEINRVNAGMFVEDTVHESVNSPDHVSLGKIDDKHPERHEHANGGKFHAFGNGADNQGGRDNGEHQLIHREHVL